MRKIAFFGALAALLALGAGTASASADGYGVGGVSDADIAAARQVAASPDTQAKLSKFFVQLDRRSGLAVQAESAKAPQVTGQPLRVFSLTPEFVTGQSTEPAGFAYLAVKTRAASGQEATVWLTRDGRQGWEASNLTTGTEEVTYPAQGGTVFTEPQINAWYRVDKGQVVPLNDPARAQVGQGMSVAAYQRLVHQQYADKLPGSAYVQQGKLGGFTPGASPTGDGSSAPVWPYALMGAGVALVVIGWSVRRVSSR
ncbi:hypothetical protein SAMN05421504_109311 [Amycolatopsis xylanica]|uniref:Uncharacterized protein n=1 Tax=Amycolatopsis xylanica TaxID=589385 RepID=A0A1H3QGN5_9PSEU|nr:hypothetical protein [Amycolatopsis xylanica]SDZ12443.1 hypothetical protein SAMN05421504_109311 [Amycolatopsis xylanica]